eukprot:123248-Chlamydomonas_euryale.AAC.3
MRYCYVPLVQAGLSRGCTRQDSFPSDAASMTQTPPFLFHVLGPGLSWPVPHTIKSPTQPGALLVTTPCVLRRTARCCDRARRVVHHRPRSRTRAPRRSRRVASPLLSSAPGTRFLRTAPPSSAVDADRSHRGASIPSQQRGTPFPSPLAGTHFCFRARPGRRSATARGPRQSPPPPPPPRERPTADLPPRRRPISRRVRSLRSARARGAVRRVAAPVPHTQLLANAADRTAAGPVQLAYLGAHGTRCCPCACTTLTHRCCARSCRHAPPLGVGRVRV